MSGPQPRSQPTAEIGASLGASPQARGAHGAIRHGAVATDATNSPIIAFSAENGPDVARFIRILLSHDEQAAHAFAAELVERGMPTAQIYEGLFAAAARELGEMWLSDDCSFYDVTLGTGRIQRLIREFSHQFLADYRYPGSSGRILLCAATDEQHSLGIAILAEFFVRDGWDVHVGLGLGSETLLDRVRESEYHLLGISVAGTSRISKLQQDIRRVRQVSRNSQIKILVGGQLITHDPSLAERIGADGFATDATSAIAEARRVITSPR